MPVDTFDKAPLYPANAQPGNDEIMRRRDRYWLPYHEALQGEVARLKRAHGRVLVWEAHSIRSHVPRFFDGRLPDFNFGTSSGASAAPGLAEALAARVLEQGGYTAVANGRFKGGYITRHYGVPATGVEAVQLGSRRSPTWKRRVLTRMTKRVRRGLCRYCRRSSKPRSRIVERGPHGCGSAAEQARHDPPARGMPHRCSAQHGIDPRDRCRFFAWLSSVR